MCIIYLHIPYKPEYKAAPYFSNEKIRKKFFQQNLIFHLALRDVSKKRSKNYTFLNNTFKI
jgi:hypothetical protein